MSAIIRPGIAASMAVAIAITIATGAAPCRALNIVATYDTSITNHPQASTIMSTINASIAMYNARIVDNTTVDITFSRMYTGLGGSSKPVPRYSYASWLSAVRNRASSLDDAVALSHLPDGPNNPVDGTPYVWMTIALGRTLALTSVAPQDGGVAPALSVVSVLRPAPDDPRARGDEPQAVTEALRRLAARPARNAATPDGYISLNLDIINVSIGIPPPDRYSLQAVTEHEIDEVLGSSSVMTGLANGAPVPSGTVHAEDLFRYQVNGARSLTTQASDSAYFSLDGTNLLARFNQNSSGDFSDWWSPSGHPIVRVQDAFGTPGTDPQMGVEWTMLDVLGWSEALPAIWVDFSYSGLHLGIYDAPYSTIASAVSAVPVGGLILVKGGHNSSELPTINKVLTITTVGGLATIGQ